MNIEINEEELGLVLELLESRVGELHSEIRRSMDHNYKDGLKHTLEVVQALETRLKSQAAG